MNIQYQVTLGLISFGIGIALASSLSLVPWIGGLIIIGLSSLLLSDALHKYFSEIGMKQNPAEQQADAHDHP